MLLDNQSDDEETKLLMHRLIGTWKSDPSDVVGIQTYGNLTLKFGADGTLLCTVHEADRDQIMRLTFRVEPGFLITDQPSKPHAERTRCAISSDVKLLLTFGSQESRYVRVGLRTTPKTT